MRIIAGQFRGSRLPSPKGPGVRPTTDRVREAIFSSLGEVIVDARVLELFAGTGAFGLEALSRGAATVTFVDRDREATEALKGTVDSFGIGRQVSILGADVLQAVAGLLGTSQRFDLVFLDPPYCSDWIPKALSIPRFFDLIDQGGLLVIEQEARMPEPAVAGGFKRRFSRTYGGTRVEIFQRQDLDVRD